MLTAGRRAAGKRARGKVHRAVEWLGSGMCEAAALAMLAPPPAAVLAPRCSLPTDRRRSGWLQRHGRRRGAGRRRRHPDRDACRRCRVPWAVWVALHRSGAPSCGQAAASIPCTLPGRRQRPRAARALIETSACSPSTRTFALVAGGCSRSTPLRSLACGCSHAGR